MAPSISICIPCYKSERFIRTTIESALAQTVPASEIVISDDNSPDRTFEILQEYSRFPVIRILRPPHRLTLGQHYRFLLEQAGSDYVCFLSHDDALMPSFIEIMRGRLEENVSLIAAACLECDQKLVPRRVRGMALPKQTLSPPEGYLHFRRGNSYTISVAVMSRRALLDVPCLPPAADLATDWYWAMMLGFRGKVKFVRNPMGYYRFHDSNAANNNPNAWRGACEAMLEFLKENVDPQYRSDKAERLLRVRAEIAGAANGAVQAAPAHSLRKRITDFAKDLIAIRYRRLPEPIAKAERGLGFSLQHSRKS
jgi:glycosyltransferase involved in cell wall biosynthesis